MIDVTATVYSLLFVVAGLLLFIAGLHARLRHESQVLRNYMRHTEHELSDLSLRLALLQARFNKKRVRDIEKQLAPKG